MAGASVILAVSAPTTLSVATAQAANITLVALARDETFEIFTHYHRIKCPLPNQRGHRCRLK
jgi:FdhD protein